METLHGALRPFEVAVEVEQHHSIILRVHENVHITSHHSHH